MLSDILINGNLRGRSAGLKFPGGVVLIFFLLIFSFYSFLFEQVFAVEQEVLQEMPVEMMSISGSQIPLSVIFDSISKAARITIMRESSIADVPLTLQMENVHPMEALDVICKMNRLDYYEAWPGVYVVYEKKNAHLHDRTSLFSFSVEKADVEQVATTIKTLYPELEVSFDSLSRRIIVTGKVTGEQKMKIESCIKDSEKKARGSREGFNKKEPRRWK